MKLICCSKASSRQARALSASTPKKFPTPRDRCRRASGISSLIAPPLDARLMGQNDLQYIQVEDCSIAYRRRSGNAPTLVFFPGYASDMEGAKALALDAFAERSGVGILRFDYSGTGSSKGAFEDGRLDRWLSEALAVIDALTEGPLILIG